MLVGDLVLNTWTGDMGIVIHITWAYAVIRTTYGHAENWEKGYVEVLSTHKGTWNDPV